jgi:hypothetical protein
MWEHGITHATIDRLIDWRSNATPAKPLLDSRDKMDTWPPPLS